MRIAMFGLAAFIAAGSAVSCLAQDLKATPRLSDTQLGFDPGGEYGNYTLTVTGPNGFHATTTSRIGAPTIDLRRFGALDDGTYNYHLTASTGERPVVRGALDNGRPGGPSTPTLRGVATGGQFHVKGGTIVKYDPAAREDAKRQK